MIKRIFILYFLTQVFFINAQTDAFQFSHITTANGLSQSSVIAIQQDQLGQMWLGTRDGLNKYDGNTFTVYRNKENNKNSISNNDISCLIEDKDGFIWIGTYNGLNKYDPKKDVFTNYFHSNQQNSLCNNTIWSLKEMSNGEIWIGTAYGLSIFNKQTNSFTTIFHKINDEKSLTGNSILSIIETKDKSVWLGTTHGLSKLVKRNKASFIFENYKGLHVNKKPIFIQDLLERDSTILIATKRSGLLYFNEKNKKIKHYLSETHQQKISTEIRKLAIDDDNNIWIGTYNGLYILKPNNTLQILKTENNNTKSLSRNSIKSILKDKKGTIWIGTYYGGVNVWDKTNNNFINYSEKDSPKKINYNVVSSIENYKHLLLFGTEGKGVNIFNTKTSSLEYIDNKNSILPNSNIKSLFVDKNNLWIGTFNNGITIYDLEKGTIRKDKEAETICNFLAKKRVYAIKKDKNNTFWFGTFGLGIIQYNPITKKFKVFKHNAAKNNSLSNNLVRTITIDAKNNIWVGTQRGLNKITKDFNIERFFYDDNVQSGDDITTVFEDKNNTIWIGTKAKGLFKLYKNKFIKIPLVGKKRIISNIHSILEDDTNNLWITTNEGIVKYNPKTKSSTIFNQKDGLVSNEFNNNSSLKVGKSQFYFGGPDGVSSFNTSSFNKNNYSPQALITDFKVKNESILVNDGSNILNQTVNFTKKLTLDYQQGNFSIQFAIPNFINSKNNSYQYRLKGLDNNWTYTSKNNAAYTIQNPGNYIFEVKGANNNSVWNQEATRLKIIVNPAPWRTWWAFLIYTLIIAIALYFLISIQKSKTKLKHDLNLEYLENERIEENNKAKLDFFTNISHEFRTPLTLILGPLQQILADYKGSSKMYKKLLVVENNAKHLLQLINRLMDFRKLEKNLFRLEAAEGNIVKFLKEIFLSFSEFAKDGNYDFNFNTTEDEILVYYDRYKLERVFYNLISNAFRYTPKNGAINVRLKKENNTIVISIDDTGVGISEENQEKIFDRFFEVAPNNNPDKNYNKGTGIGLSIAKNIVDLHKGSLTVTNNKNNVGSIFTVTLPLGKNHLEDDEIIKDFKFSDDVSQYVNQLTEPTVIIEDELTDKITDVNKNTILLVEDNKPLRKFMKDLLKEKYNILEAENGKIALNMAIKHLPDLIVSDVVMPVMAGTELCAEIKNTIKISHIPIILLTSRSSLIYKLEGLESGADAYISKPFNVDEFKVRIKKLLETSNRLKEKFSSNDHFIQNEVIISSLDEQLYKKALKIVENNIDNVDFDIPYFCSELGVSRTMLFVKMKAWTNFTPNDFIQHIRLKHAALLLEQGKINISEVSYKVGFKNPKYFSKCFQKKYGESPKKYSTKFSDI